MIVPALLPGVLTILLFGDRISFARIVVSIKGGWHERGRHTSQWFRMVESPPATDLRGGKASEDSFTIWIASLVVAYTVDFRPDLFSSIFGSTMRFEGSKFWPRPVLKTDRIRSEMVRRPVLYERNAVR